jgi:hypothetical protein
MLRVSVLEYCTRVDVHTGGVLVSSHPKTGGVFDLRDPA